jgi:hypothetical protein
MIDKRTISELRYLAKMLPHSYTEMKEVRLLLGEQLIMRGINEIDDTSAMPETEWVNNEPVHVFPKIVINPKKYYTFKNSSEKVVNHFKMLKKAYLKNGPEGVRAYAQEIHELHVTSTMPQSIGGIMTLPN